MQIIDLVLVLAIAYISSLLFLICYSRKIFNKFLIEKSKETKYSISNNLTQVNNELVRESTESGITPIVSDQVKLSVEELKIIKFLLNKGGEAYQVEIYKTLNLPKSSTSRILRRLAERGLIEIERRGKYNYN